MKQQYKRLKTRFFNALLALALLPSSSFAASISSVIDNAVDYLQGTLARSVGVMSIAIAGYLCIGKQMFPKMYFIMILVGLGLIFGAAELYALFVS